MKKRWVSFSSLPIYRQFILISAISMLMAVVLSLLLLHSAQNIFIANATNYAQIYMERFSNELENLCLQLDIISSQLQTDQIYQELLSTESYRELDAQVLRDVDDEVSSIKSVYPKLSDVAFSNDLIHQSVLFSAEDLDAMYRDTASDEKNIGQGLGLMKSSFLPLSGNTFYVYRSNIYRNGKAIGCVFLSMDIEELQPEPEEDDQVSYYCMDNSGSIYAMGEGAAGHQNIIVNACREYLTLQNDPGEGKYPDSYKVRKDPFLIQMNYSQSAGCYIISAVHIPSVSSMLNNIWYYLVIILAAFVLLVGILMWNLYRNMIRPLNEFNHLIDDMGSSGQRHLSQPLEIKGCAEVRNLALNFSNLFSAIDKLNMQIFETSTKLYEEKIRGQATEISYFQSQINPHFLYNVLSLIRSLALSHNVPEIASIAVSMGKMYRYNTKGAPIVPFREELEMTRAYVEIQKYRFQDKFNIYYNISEDALEIPVIKLSLQPIVENAIQHGIEPSLNRCLLYIGASVTEGELLIEVRDDGVGMPPQRLQELQTLLQKTQADTSRFVGTLNTNARLKLQYGAAYGLSIESQENDGTTVKIRIPAKQTTEDRSRS